MRNISATRMKTFYACPLKYRFQYHYKLMQRKSDALLIGTLYHEALEMWHNGDYTGALLIGLGEEKETQDVVWKLLSKYIKNPVEGSVTETEVEFSIEVEDLPVPIYGFIDREDEDKDVEYKSSSKKWNAKELEDNEIQTKMYLYSSYRKHGKPRKLVYSVNNKKTKVPPQLIEIERTEEEILSFENDLRKFVQDVDSSDFEATPGSQCFFCPWGNRGDGTCKFSK